MLHALMMHIVKTNMGLRIQVIRIHVYTQEPRHVRIQHSTIKAASYKVEDVSSFLPRLRGAWKRSSEMLRRDKWVYTRVWLLSRQIMCGKTDSYSK